MCIWAQGKQEKPIQASNTTSDSMHTQASLGSYGQDAVQASLGTSCCPCTPARQALVATPAYLCQESIAQPPLAALGVQLLQPLSEILPDLLGVLHLEAVGLVNPVPNISLYLCLPKKASNPEEEPALLGVAAAGLFMMALLTGLLAGVCVAG